MNRFNMGAAALCIASASPAAAADLSVSVGRDYSEGDYGGASDTTLNLTSLSVRAGFDRGSISLSSGYVDLSGEAEVITLGPGGGIEITPAGSGDVSGFSDLVISGSYLARQQSATRPGVRVFGAVKLPTADPDEGLGSGGTDVSASVEVFQSFGAVTPYAYAGARLRGEGDFVETRDAFQGGLGLQSAVAENWNWVASYDYRGAGTEGGDEAHELTTFLSWSARERLTFSIYAYTGFTDASPDFGAGLVLSRSFGRR